MSNVVLFPQRNIKTLSKADRFRTLAELKLALAECYDSLADASAIDENELSLTDILDGASA